MADQTTEMAELSEDTALRIPDNVVWRTFAAETVVLNIDSGQYHGLNAVAGRMLEVLQRHQSVSAAIDPLALEFEQPKERIRSDLLALCEGLRERGLIEVGEADGG